MFVRFSTDVPVIVIVSSVRSCFHAEVIVLLINVHVLVVMFLWLMFVFCVSFIYVIFVDYLILYHVIFKKGLNQSLG